MEPEFALGAAELLSRFAVHGRYYERSFCGVKEQLRDRLEIAPIDWSLDKILTHRPDLLVVMMNPGGSRPLNALWDAHQNQGFTAAQPDRTQYQIMRLMLTAQRYGQPWEHARIVNLSDLRTPKSAEMLQKLHTYQADDSHSVFSLSRAEECKILFADKSIPVLCGWGLNGRLENVARAALMATSQHNLLGVTADGVMYRHPLPQRHDFQMQWLSKVAMQVRAMIAKKTLA